MESISFISSIKKILYYLKQKGYPKHFVSIITINVWFFLLITTRFGRITKLSSNPTFHTNLFAVWYNFVQNTCVFFSIMLWMLLYKILTRYFSADGHGTGWELITILVQSANYNHIYLSYSVSCCFSYNSNERKPYAYTLVL